jgi:hypothetical protein
MLEYLCLEELLYGQEIKLSLKKAAIIILCLITTPFVVAQKIGDAIYVAYSDMPISKSIEYPEFEWKTNRLELMLNGRIKVKDSTWKVFPNMAYVLNQFESKSSNSALLQSEKTSLHSIVLGTNILKQFNSKWGALGVVNIAHRTNFENYSFDKSIFPNLALAATYKIREGFVIQAGAAFNNDIGRKLFLPYIGYFFISRNKKWSSELLFPNAHITYHTAKNFELGVASSFNATIHHTEVTQVNNKSSEFLRMQTVSYGPFISTKVTKKIWFTVRGGFTILREHQRWDADYSNTIDPNLNGKNSFFFRTLFSYRIN